MPKIHKTSMMKTARATPYSYSTADVTEAIDLEGNEGTAATEVDSVSPLTPICGQPGIYQRELHLSSSKSDCYSQNPKYYT